MVVNMHAQSQMHRSARQDRLQRLRWIRHRVIVLTKEPTVALVGERLRRRCGWCGCRGGGGGCERGSVAGGGCLVDGSARIGGYRRRLVRDPLRVRMWSSNRPLGVGDETRRSREDNRADHPLRRRAHSRRRSRRCHDVGRLWPKPFDVDDVGTRRCFGDIERDEVGGHQLNGDQQRANMYGDRRRDRNAGPGPGREHPLHGRWPKVRCGPQPFRYAQAFKRAWEDRPTWCSIKPSGVRTAHACARR